MILCRYGKVNGRDTEREKGERKRKRLRERAGESGRESE